MAGLPGSQPGQRLGPSSLVVRVNEAPPAMDALHKVLRRSEKSRSYARPTAKAASLPGLQSGKVGGPKNGEARAAESRSIFGPWSWRPIAAGIPDRRETMHLQTPRTEPGRGLRVDHASS